MKEQEIKEKIEKLNTELDELLNEEIKIQAAKEKIEARIADVNNKIFSLNNFIEERKIGIEDYCDNCGAELPEDHPLTCCEDCFDGSGLEEE